MKSTINRVRVSGVAPYAGAWIEINVPASASKSTAVAPYAGAWIEIEMLYAQAAIVSVAPYAGAWIEIPMFYSFLISVVGRSLRGSVD